MTHPLRPTPRRWYSGLVCSLALTAGLHGDAAVAQEPPAAEPPVVTTEPVAAAAEQGVVATPLPVPQLNLDECLALAFAKQPALSAARASLNAAHDGRRALGNMPLYARLLSRDLPVRRTQACVGINIAAAGLQQAEWETRYSVTRNYYSVLYVRGQQLLLDDVLGRLERGRGQAKKILDAGDVTKVTKIDLDIFGANIDLLRLRQSEAKSGMLRALAALREAIGVGPEYPLDVDGGTLPPVVASLNRDELIALALANRGEIVQANSANELTRLEIEAQSRKRGLQVPTFGAGSDIHAKPIPQGVFNNDYRPGAIGIEMPNFLIGRKGDRIDRAASLNERAGAVVEKTYNLVSLEAENYYLKWQEAKERLDQLNTIEPKVKDIAATMEKRLDQGNASGKEYIDATTLWDTVRAQQNEALYNHALALTALERITAGGFRIHPGKHP